MNRRVVLLFLLSFVTGYLAIAGDTGLPLPGNHGRQSPAAGGGGAVAAGLGHCVQPDVIWMGLNSLRDRLLTLHTVADAAIVFTVVDALVYCLAGRQGPRPLLRPGHTDSVLPHLGQL